METERRPMWFKRVFGFDEPSQYEDVRSLFSIEESDFGDVVLKTIPKDNSSPRSFHVGKFETPCVSELRDKVQQEKRRRKASGDELPVVAEAAGMTFQHISGDAGALHRDPNNAGAVFQAASQFNCLEMMNPGVTPENGISSYFFDRTQGPTCALACPSATLFRNYFVNANGQGGILGRQLDMLHDAGVVLGNEEEDNSEIHSERYWKMRNGYALPINTGSIIELRRRMELGEVDVVAARDQLRVGVHWNTEVDASAPSDRAAHNVTQVYCSAMPVGYHDTPHNHWLLLAQIVLDGLYEATLAVAAVKAHQSGERVSVYLTMVGGGVFENRAEWIIQAIDRALRLYEDEPIDIYLLHYRHIDKFYQQRLPEIVNGYVVALCENV
jgi:hypothetical protein